MKERTNDKQVWANTDWFEKVFSAHVLEVLQIQCSEFIKACISTSLQIRKVQATMLVFKVHVQWISRIDCARSNHLVALHMMPGVSI